MYFQINKPVLKIINSLFQGLLEPVPDNDTAGIASKRYGKERVFLSQGKRYSHPGGNKEFPDSFRFWLIE